MAAETKRGGALCKCQGAKVFRKMVILCLLCKRLARCVDLHIVCQASICYCHMREYAFSSFFFNVLPVLLLFSLRLII